MIGGKTGWWGQRVAARVSGGAEASHHRANVDDINALVARGRRPGPCVEEVPEIQRVAKTAGVLVGSELCGVKALIAIAVL